MKQLMIFRHGEANPKREQEDIRRTLTPDGIKQINSVGSQYLPLSHEWTINHIFCSPATRTLESLDYFLHATKQIIPTKQEEKLYRGTLDDILQTITSFDDELQTVLMIGHNPLWSNLVSELTKLPCRLSTAHLFLLRKKISSWSDITTGESWQVVNKITP